MVHNGKWWGGRIYDVDMYELIAGMMVMMDIVVVVIALILFVVI